jgi:hypothetical protein
MSIRSVFLIISKTLKTSEHKRYFVFASLSSESSAVNFAVISIEGKALKLSFQYRSVVIPDRYAFHKFESISLVKIIKLNYIISLLCNNILEKIILVNNHSEPQTLANNTEQDCS